MKREDITACFARDENETGDYPRLECSPMNDGRGDDDQTLIAEYCDSFSIGLGDTIYFAP